MEQVLYPILLIHGNSPCRGVFRRQLESELTEMHRLIAFDLPGHGDPSNAQDPHRSYTLPGFDDATVDLLGVMGICEVIVSAAGPSAGALLWRCLPIFQAFGVCCSVARRPSASLMV